MWATITDESKLLVANVALFQDRLNIEVRTQHEAVAIDRAAREIQVKELSTGRMYRESYDALVPSPGAAAVRPQLPGFARDLRSAVNSGQPPHSRMD